MRWIRHFVASEEGPTSVEYAVLLALILMAIMSAIGAVGAQTGGMWGNIDSDMAQAGLGAS
jgi:pilus assembly protein Flp/PilA